MEIADHQEARRLNAEALLLVELFPVRDQYASHQGVAIPVALLDLFLVLLDGKGGRDIKLSVCRQMV